MLINLSIKTYTLQGFRYVVTNLQNACNVHGFCNQYTRSEPGAVWTLGGNNKIIYEI